MCVPPPTCTAKLISLAKDSNIIVVWPDPTLPEESEFLSKSYAKDLVFYFFFARSAGAWLRAGTVGAFDEVILKAVSATARRIPGAPDTIDAYRAIHAEVFKRPFGVDEKEAAIRASAPVYRDSIINDIARSDSRFRNERVLSEVERYWNEGYSIFMLFGAAHAVIQEPALRSLVR